VAAYYASKEANSKMTFGFVRSEMMAAFVNSAFLCVTMLFVMFEAVKRVLNPSSIDASQVIWVAVLALAANGVSAYLLKDEHHRHEHSHERCDHGHDHRDLNMKAAYLHMLGDAAISLGVIIGAVATIYLDTPYIDPFLSIAFGLYILKSSFAVLKESFYSLMDANKDDIEKVESSIKELREIHSLHDVHMASPSSKDKYFSAHIVLKEDLTMSQTEELLEAVRDRLRGFGITHSVLQPETLKYAGASGHCCTH